METTENKTKIEMLHEQLERKDKELIDLRIAYEKIQKDCSYTRSELSDTRRMNERLLNIIENLSEK